MDDLLNYGVEELSGLLKENANTRFAFRTIVDVIADISEFISAEDKGVVRTLVRKLQKSIMLCSTKAAYVHRRCLLVGL